jgi:hypothetical protein
LIIYYKLANKIITFQEALQFKDSIILCYNMQNNVKISGRVPPLLTWQISHIIVDCFYPIVGACVLNQFSSHWLLYDALQYAIIMCLKIKEEVTYPPPQVNLIDDDYGMPLNYLCLLPILRRMFVMF